MDPKAEACSRSSGQAQVLLDRRGEMARRYNALWLPRAYALDERGVMTYAQSERTLDPQAPLQVEALWRGSGRQVAERNGAADAR
jgi:hypothetical protein